MPGAVPQHLDLRADQRDAAVRRRAGRQGLARGLRGRPRASPWASTPTPASHQRRRRRGRRHATASPWTRCWPDRSPDRADGPPHSGRAGRRRVARPPRGRARASPQHPVVLPPRPAPLPRVPRPRSGVERPRRGHRGDVAAFLVGLREGDADHPPLAASSAARTVVAVRGFHQFCAPRAWLDADPAGGVQPADAARAAAQGDLASSDVERLLEAAGSATPRLACATGRCSRCSTAPAPGSPRRSASTSTTSTGTTASCGCAARAARSGWCPSGRYAARGGRRPTSCAAARRSPPRGRGTPALFLNARGGRLSRQSAWAVLRAGGRAGRRRRRRLAAHAAALVRHPPARRRRRRPRRPGAARPRLGDDHPGLHAGHRGPLREVYAGHPRAR